MGIGREIGGNVVLDVPTTDTEGPQPFVAKAGQHGGRFCDKKIGPNPGETTEGHFQAAGPVYAEWVGVFSVPVLPLVEYFLGKLLITGKPVRLRQNHKMLMAIQLPNDFAVASFFKIQIANFEPELSGRSFNMNPVEMPINLRAIIKVFITKQIKAMAGDLLCPADNLACLLRKTLLQQ